MTHGAATARASERIGYSLLSIGFGAWLAVGVALVNWADRRGLVQDIGFSPYHVPAYLGLLSLAVISGLLVANAVRHGRAWREAFPPGYGVIGVGLLLALAYPVADVAWRDGVGPTNGIEGTLAPSRLLVPLSTALIAVAPLRLAARVSVSHAGRWAAALSAAIVLAVLSVPGEFHPAASPWLEQAAGPQVGNAEVWSMAADGSRQTRLIESDGRSSASWATWSPDGSQVTWTRWTTDPEGLMDADIWVANADGSAPRKLIGGPGWQWIPHWSPDGTRIAFTQEAARGPGVTVGPVGPNVGPGLGPVFDTGASPRSFASIWIAEADGTGAVRLTDGTADDRAGAFSPDGARLVFDSLRDGNTEIYVMNADGSDQRRLTSNGVEDWGASWSPDGTRIAFNSDERIVVMNADGSNQARLTSDNVFEREPIWSPDGTRIAYQAMGDLDWAIWSIGTDGTDPADLSRSPGASLSLGGASGAWSPDGRIVFSREADPPAFAQPLVRADLAAGSLLLEALLTALVALALLRADPPFGAFALLLGIAALLPAIGEEQWRFVPAIALAGLGVDVLVHLATPDRRPRVAGAASAAALVVGAGGAVLATGTLASPTLVLGIALASAILGWALGAALGSGTGSTAARADP